MYCNSPQFQQVGVAFAAGIALGCYCNVAGPQLPFRFLPQEMLTIHKLVCQVLHDIYAGDTLSEQLLEKKACCVNLNLDLLAFLTA